MTNFNKSTYNTKISNCRRNLSIKLGILGKVYWIEVCKSNSKKLIYIGI